MYHKWWYALLSILDVSNKNDVKKPDNCLFVCLFVWGFTSHSSIFNSFLDVTITGRGLQILLVTHGYWAVRVLYRATPTVTNEYALLQP